jgi:pSer/pThr/pTyr-binding forkhead associated (FHA) protein
MPLRFRILPPPVAPQPEQGLPDGAGAGAPSSGPGEERTFELTADATEVRLGRQPTCEIELPFPAVSGVHARLFRGDSAHEWWLEDQGSTNGTWLDGQRLAPRRPALIRAGQRIRIGSADIVFEGWAPTAKGGESTATIARRLIGDLFGAAGNEAPVLAVAGGQAVPAILVLSERERRYTAGRADTCDLVIKGDQASREHALFERRWEGVFVSDLGSRNGISVNGTAIAGARRLRDGDSVQIGGATFRFTDPEDRYLQRLEAIEDSAPGVKAVATQAPVATAPPRAVSAPAPQAARDRSRKPAPGAGGRHDVPLSRGRKVAMALAAAVLVVAVTGLILLLVG